MKGWSDLVEDDISRNGGHFEKRSFKKSTDLAT
jgi:hypothetical protein